MTLTPLIINSQEWKTPLTGTPLQTVNTARLRHLRYRGTYYMEGVKGHEYYRTTSGWLPVVGLQQRQGRRWETWMVDDPLHWYGIGEAVDDLPDGRILVAGLGLGLMLHHMATQPRFTRITVVEVNPDVIALIAPLAPKDDRIQIIEADFYRYIESITPADIEGVFWDLAVGTPQETWPSMLRGSVLCDIHLPGVPVVQFGKRKQPRNEPRRAARKEQK